MNLITKKTVLVTSTINVPFFLEGICDNAKKYNFNEYSILVIGDVKTPVEAKQYCSELSKKFNNELLYLDIKDQENYLEEFKDIFDFIPLNNNARKMIGTILAFVNGCERVIMIDDDNYATEKNFFKYHLITGKTQKLKLVESSDGWFNIAECMIEKNNIPFYPRGYPWNKRFVNNINKKIFEKEVEIAVNAGLVLGDPDVDAVSRLFWPLEVNNIRKNFLPNFALYPQTWSPFNDQNTSLCRNLIPIYYKPPSVLRNADIWSAYFIEKLCGFSNQVISYGEPLVFQKRNEHDFRKDYSLEEVHNRATDLFVQMLRDIEINFTTYTESAEELIGKFLQVVNHDINHPYVLKNEESRHAHMTSNIEKEKQHFQDLEMIQNFLNEYKLWIELIKKYKLN